MRHPPRQPSGYRPGKYPCPGTRRTRIGSLNPGCLGEPVRGRSVYLYLDVKENPSCKQDCSTGSLCPGTLRPPLGSHNPCWGVCSVGKRWNDTWVASPSERGHAPEWSRVQRGVPVALRGVHGAGCAAGVGRASLAEEVGDCWKSFSICSWFARGVTQCIAQDVRRLIITLPMDGQRDGAGEGKVNGSCSHQAPVAGGAWELPAMSHGCTGRHVASGRGLMRGALVP